MTSDAVDLEPTSSSRSLEAAHRSLKQGDRRLNGRAVVLPADGRDEFHRLAGVAPAAGEIAISATISGEPQVWVRDGWAERCGMPGERTGMGDTSAQVTAFRIERAVLFGYVDAAHRGRSSACPSSPRHSLCNRSYLTPGEASGVESSGGCLRRLGTT